jgi:endonuclease YncB( thermonuclease family)
MRPPAGIACFLIGVSLGCWLQGGGAPSPPEGQPAGRDRIVAPAGPFVGLPASGPVSLWVRRAVDGDTFEAAYLVGPEHVRIEGIDTPERGKPGYQEAKFALDRLLMGGHRVVECELAGRDKYGRLVAKARSPIDGADCGARLVEMGLAKPWSGRGEKP